jgi:hypothetical protein
VKDKLAKNELWRRGILTWKLHATQKRIAAAIDASQGKLFVAVCSRQLGKSYLCVVRAIEAALRKPDTRIKYATAFLSDLQEFIIPAFDKVLADCPETVRPKFKSQQGKYCFPNGSEIKLIGLDLKPNGLRGNTIDLIVLDESGFIGNLKYLYDSVIMPSTMHRPHAKIIMISTPPVSPDHDFTEFALRAEKQCSLARFTIHENPLLTTEQIAELCNEAGGEKSTTWRREYLCEFINDTSLAIVPEWDDKFIGEPEEDPYFKYYHKYEALDIGAVDYTACLFGYYDFNRAKMVIVDELEMHGPTMTTDKLVQGIREKEKERGFSTVYRRIADNNNLILLQDLSLLHQLNFSPTSKDELHAMINELRLWVRQGRLQVHPRCKMLIGNLKYGLFNQKRTKFENSKVYGHFDHLAALVYLIRNIDQHSNPIPPSREWSIDIISNLFEQTKKHSVLRKMFGVK